MTISLYSGTPGSGKSLAATMRILKHLKRGYPVIANYSLIREKIPNSDNFTFVDNKQLSAAYLVDFARGWFGAHDFKEDSILLVIDECQ